MDKTDFKAAAKQYTSLLTLPTELLEEATELDFEAGANYCYKEITEPTIKQNAEYKKALYELLEALYDSRAQIEYLHNKFQKTGTSESVLRNLESIIEKYEKKFA